MLEKKVLLEKHHQSCWKLSNDAFWRNQTWKIVLTRNCSISKFWTMWPHYICIKGLTTWFDSSFEDINEIYQRSIFCRTLGRVTKIYLLTQTIMNKVYETMSRNPEKLDKTRKDQSFIFGRKTGCLALPPTFFEVFPMFSNFLFQVTLYLWQIEPVLKSWNLSLFSLHEKCQNTELFLVRIFLHSDWIRRFIL